VRPAILDKLFAPATALPGIGSQIAKLFERLAGPLVLDLVWHLPSGIIDRRASPPIRQL
jgi:ATP-dependent DNA helicase RecG